MLLSTVDCFLRFGIGCKRNQKLGCCLDIIGHRQMLVINSLVGGSKGIIVESAPLQKTVISLVTGCLKIIDIHLRDESNGRIFNTSNSNTLFPTKKEKK